MYLNGGMGSERACDSATVGPIYGNHLHMSLGMGVWGPREPATVRQGGPNMEIICIDTQAHVFEWGGYGLRESLRQCDRWAHKWKSFAYVIYIYMTPYPHAKTDSCHGGMGLREPATVRQGGPNMEIICIYTQAYVFEWGYGLQESLRQCDSKAPAHALAWGYGD